MILVFGSLNMDLVMTVPVLPKPGETVLCPGYTLKPGGKGNNQAVAAARAGAPVAMAGCIGPDAFGSGLVENLVRAGIDTSSIHLVEQPTGCAMICVDADAENFITVASGANLAASSDRIADCTLGPGTTVLMQMEVPAEQNWALIRRAHELGSRTVLNVAPAADVPPDVLKLIDVLVVNEHEAAEIADRLGLSTSSSTGLARDLARTCGVTCVVTLGSAGALDGRVGWSPLDGCSAEDQSRRYHRGRRCFLRHSHRRTRRRRRAEGSLAPGQRRRLARVHGAGRTGKPADIRGDRCPPARSRRAAASVLTGLSLLTCHRPCHGPTVPCAGKPARNQRRYMPIINRIADFHEEMTAWRRDLHAHPETAFEEFRTSGIVAAKLEEWGIEVHRGLGGTGVVGTLKGASSSGISASGINKSIALRADMDALNMQEQNDFPHASRIPGKMHGCGHDGRQ